MTDSLRGGKSVKQNAAEKKGGEDEAASTFGGGIKKHGRDLGVRRVRRQTQK